MTTTNHSTSEVGHAKNVANFQDLIAFCESYGTDYNPSSTPITIEGLWNKHQEADDSILNVHTTKAAFEITTNERQEEFANLEALSTRILNALAVTTNDSRIVADARTLVNRIRGKAPKPKTDDQQPGQEVSQPRSNSQQSYDKLIDNFTGLLQLLSQTGNYTPNESELQIIALENYLKELKTSNTGVINAYTQYSKAMLDRNYIIYDKITGLVHTAAMVKKYVKSIYGANSSQYSQVSGLEFKSIKK